MAIRWRLLRESSAGAEVRRRIVLATRGILSQDGQDLLRLLVTELINNSVQHAGAQADRYVTVQISISEECLRAVVRDGGRGFDARSLPRPIAGTALRGLQLVDRLASRWGSCADGGNCVWFELE